MREGALSPDEVRIWTAWKRAGEGVMTRVGRDIQEATGLSGGEFGVVSRLVELGGGELRQSELSASLGWDKSRLSHQLTRMEARGLLGRRPAEPRGVLVQITAAGRKLLALARPVHARAVRTHLLAKLSAAERTLLLALLTRLEDGS